MKHFILFYTLSADYLERRAEFRTEHLRLAWEAQERGDIVLAGALSDPADTAVLLFKGEDGRAAEAFARSDPYVTNGLVERWEVRPWTTVIGDLAATPVRP
ncbi:YciI family protein [Sphingomonas piscis]|uniref:YciI family protein n=1 Tax=Sphingomonas piscis TaxID=2714943 RepID=A0A6G7YPD4_9SPHN|nr:YciI-like protein [Sphingomonas piscis]QIK78602.1 YciI family protein [Sphingomonas piscis]